MADVVDIPEFRAFYYTDDTPRQFYTLRRYEDESGSGEMHCYNIAPGIQLSFNDLNLSSCYQPLNVQKDFLTLGGIDVKTVEPEVLLKNYAIVFQNVTLFDESVMENIRLGRSGASDEDVRAAAKAAQCDEFIDRLPQGYDTNIGENGSKLSGGERQRISIARALLKNAPVILLDEATASMDAESETMVQTALSALLKGRTVIVIAHRMRTIANADKIVVLDKGKVTEVGTPSELAKKGGLYAHLVALQQKQQMSSLPT